jgi:hypothetical protein
MAVVFTRRGLFHGMSRGVTDWGYYRAVLRLTSTTCSNDPPPIISLITILKTLVKRCISVMSRHRYVRNLDVDGTQFPSSSHHPELSDPQRSATMVPFPMEEMT